MTTRKSATDKGFIIFTDQLPLLSCIDDASLGKAIKLLLQNFDTLEELKNNDTVKLAYELIATNIRRYREQSIKAREDGLKGGNPTVKGGVKGTHKGGVKGTHKGTVKGTVKQQDNTIHNITIQNNTIKEINNKDNNIELLGEFKNVKLTKEEIEKVKNIYQDKFSDAIELLSNYIASSGKKYKSHYAVLGKHNWVYSEIFKNNKSSEKLDISKMSDEELYNMVF